jgi:alpha-tubulin suppressor-like RCC1 family protein
MTLRLSITVLLLAGACLIVSACGGSNHKGVHSVTSVRHPPSPAGGGVYSFGDVAAGHKLRAFEHKTPTPVAGINGKVIQVAISNSDGYALTAAGAVFAWGAGGRGELGDGQRSRFAVRAVRVRFPAGVKIVSLPSPMPFDGALALDSDGHAWGWGLNRSADLCLSRRLELMPRQIPLSDVTLATGARIHSLFYSGGRLYACGSGLEGALGDGSGLESRNPVAVRGLPAGVKITALTSSWEGSGALLRNGAYYNWGYNAGGQLGDDSTANSALPVRVRLPGPVRQVSQGGSLANNGQTLAILADGSVWTWGDGSWGQLGNGATTRSLVPLRVRVPAGVTFKQVNSGGYASYAIDTAGRLWVWGANDRGQLGIGSDAMSVRHPVQALRHVRQVSSTATNVVVLTG